MVVVSVSTTAAAAAAIARAVRIREMAAAFVPIAAVGVGITYAVLAVVAAIVVAILIADELHAWLQDLHLFGQLRIAASARRHARRLQCSEQHRRGEQSHSYDQSAHSHLHLL